MSEQPQFTELSSFAEPLVQFGDVWLRISAVQAVDVFEGDVYSSAYTEVLLAGGSTVKLNAEGRDALLAYLEGGQDK